MMKYQIFLIFSLIYILIEPGYAVNKYKNVFNLKKYDQEKFKNSELYDECNQVFNFPQYVDHFKYSQKDSLKYQQRYILWDKYLNPGSSDYPIFFYTGNEGDIQWFCQNTGFVWELAQSFDALVVFAEHRYYGTSLPFGNQSFQSPYLDYLTTEQALADYAVLIDYLKSTTPGAKNSPVISFGGSYGGMLSAYFRMKYPNIVTGALAASAPIYQFTSECDSFSRVVTDDFKKADPKCAQTIRSSWDIINNLAKSQQGLDTLTKIFHLCTPLKDVNDLKGWLSDTYGNTAMVDYPYATNFLSNLPAWPVKVMCSSILKKLDKEKSDDPITVLNAIYSGVNVYQNYSGDAKCFDFTPSSDDIINYISWGYQVCTEYVFPTCSTGVNDMFEPQEWDPVAYAKDCKSQFQVNPRSNWAIINYGSSDADIKTHSNIIFSNGDLDPWSAGGVRNTINDKLPAIIIQNGAHHLDLRASNVNDPDSVISARLREMDIIQDWIEGYQLKMKKQKKINK